MTHGKNAARFNDVYGAEASKETISRSPTGHRRDGGRESRPLDPMYPVMFVDAMNVKMREGQVANRPIYVALAVTVAGKRDILGLWAGEHGDGEGAKYWLQVYSEIKNRGIEDCLIVVCDGLKGLPEAVATTGRRRSCRPCRAPAPGSFRYAGRQDRDAIARIKRVYTAPTEAAAKDRFAEFSEEWGASTRPSCDLDQRLAGVRAVPGIRRRDPQRHLDDERDRDSTPASGEPSRPAATSPTSRRAQMPVPVITGPHRGRPGTLGMRWLSRPEARCRHYCRSVSSDRSPNPACAFPRTGLSTVGSVRHGSFAGRGWGSSGRGSGNE